MLGQLRHLLRVAFLKPSLHLNVNRIVQYRRITEGRQTAFGCATNVRQTAKCYPSTVSTSKGIHIQYVYVGSIRCHGKCRTVYEPTIHSASALNRMRRSRLFAFGCKPGLTSPPCLLITLGLDNPESDKQ